MHVAAAFRRPTPSSRSLRAAAAISAIGLVIGFVSPVRADSADDERRRLAEVTNQLEALQHKLDDVTEAYAEAKDRTASLNEEVNGLQKQVDAEAGTLTELQAALDQIAVDRYINSGSASSNALLSDATSYSEARQRDALAGVALNNGVTDADATQAQVDKLVARKRKLDKTKREAAQVEATLAQRQADLDSATAEYTQKRKQAEADLGVAEIKAEEERRAAEAAARSQAILEAAQKKAAEAKRIREQRQREQQNNPQTPPHRGGGDNNPSGGDGNGGTPGTRPPRVTKPTRPGEQPPETKPPKSETTKPSAPSGGGGDGGGGDDNPPGPSSKAGIAVRAARSVLGVPYVAYQANPDVGFDCSGLTMWAWGKAGERLPHYSKAQYAVLPHVSEGDVAPGDLLFFHSPISHVAIYIGGGSYIHAPRTGDVVKIAAANWGKVVGVGRPG